MSIPSSSTALDRARAKAYRRLLPLLFLCYVIAYVDRTNVSIAALTMTKDLPGFDNAVFGFGSGVFFIGYSHNPLHVPTTEMASLWADAVLRGDLQLPAVDDMAQSAERVAAWKRKHTNFEPSRGYFVSTHLHNYLDVLLGDIGLRSRRKKNSFGEAMQGYAAADYATIIAEYEAVRGTPRTAMAFDT